MNRLKTAITTSICSFYPIEQGEMYFYVLYFVHPTPLELFLHPLLYDCLEIQIFYTRLKIKKDQILSNVYSVSLDEYLNKLV